MRLTLLTESHRRLGAIAAITALAAIACSSAASGIATPSNVPPPAASANLPQETEVGGGPQLTPTPAPPRPTATPPGILDEKFTAPFEKLTPSGARDIDPDEYRAQTDVDNIAPIYDPKIVSADQVDLLPEELVLGVEINGEARAYPHRLMQFREIANDVVGGVPILVSWCPVCFTGLIHDRRLDGTVKTFGNQGALFMNALTFWDHETKSIWSQPWGTAIAGELKGSTLTLLPFSLDTWGAWLEAHPDTTVVEDERGKVFLPDLIPYDYVIGVSIKEDASSYYVNSLLDTTVLNHTVGDNPIVVITNPETRKVRVFLRRTTGTPADKTAIVPDLFTFEGTDDGRMRDLQTGTIWEFDRGLALEGPLRGTVLQQVPYITSFDWAWADFFPETTVWGETGLTGSGEVIELGRGR